MPETEGFNLEAGHDRPDPCNEILQVDGLDMVRQAAEDEIDEAIVHPDNWAKSDRVVARRLGISHMQVNRLGPVVSLEATHQPVVVLDDHRHFAAHDLALELRLQSLR